MSTFKPGIVRVGPLHYRFLDEKYTVVVEVIGS